MRITGFSIPTQINLSNALKVSGFSLLQPFIQFAVARIVDEIGGRNIDSVVNAELRDSLSNPNYQTFPNLALTFSSPPVSDQTGFDFGWTPTTVKLFADIAFTQAGYTTPSLPYEIELKFLTV